MRMRDLCIALIKNVSAEKWIKCCNHIITVEQSYWKSDGFIYEGKMKSSRPSLCEIQDKQPSGVTATLGV